MPSWVGPCMQPAPFSPDERSVIDAIDLAGACTLPARFDPVIHRLENADGSRLQPAAL